MMSRAICVRSSANSSCSGVSPTGPLPAGPGRFGVVGATRPSLAGSVERPSGPGFLYPGGMVTLLSNP